MNQAEMHPARWANADTAAALDAMGKIAATLTGAALCWIGRIFEENDGKLLPAREDLVHAPGPLAEPGRIAALLDLFAPQLRAGHIGRSDALSPRKALAAGLAGDSGLTLCWPVGSSALHAAVLAQFPSPPPVAELSRKIAPLLAGLAPLLQPHAPTGQEAGDPARTERRDLVVAIDRLERMRRREHEMRMETEALLSGLRILTQPQAAPLAFAALLDALRSAMPYAHAAVLRVRWPEGLTLLTGTSPVLQSVDWEELRRESEALPMDPIRHGPESSLARALRRAGIPAAALISAPLTIRGEQGWLLFGTDAADGFTIGHVGLAARLALLATHALAVEAEKARTVQSSKMALLGEMATGIAHELAQPVNAIGLTAQNLHNMLREGDADPAGLVAKVERIQSQVNRAAKVIKRMRVFGRRASGQAERFDIAESVANAIDIAGPQLRRIGIEVDVALETTRHLYGDPIQFEQILVNLLINARDAIEDGRAGGRKTAGQVRIIAGEEPDGHVRITVRDDGPGFPDAILPLAFEPFFTTKERGRGTGLGLSICRDIAVEMGGTIAVANDGGACITLRLPSAEISTLPQPKSLQSNPVQISERFAG